MPGLRYEYYSPYSEADNRLVTLDAAPGLHGRGAGHRRRDRPVFRSTARHDRPPVRARAGAACRRRLAAHSRHGRPGGYGINYNASAYQYDRPAARRSAAVRDPRHLDSVPEHACCRSTRRCCTCSPASRHQHLRRRSGLPPRLRPDLESRLSARPDADGAARHRLHRHEGHRTSTSCARRIAVRTVCSIPGVPPFIWESSDADSIMHVAYVPHPPAADQWPSRGRHLHVVASRSTTPRRWRRWRRWSRRTIWTWLRSAACRASISVTGSPATSPSICRSARTSAGSTRVPRRPCSATGRSTATRRSRRARRSPRACSAASRDVASGVNGTLRANYNGQPIDARRSDVALFFNTAAFSIPAPGTFGNAGRNTIIGPGTSVLNLGVTKNITLSQTRGLSIQLLATNVFNTVQFASIDTYVNSPTFGQVTSVAADAPDSAADPVQVLMTTTQMKPRRSLRCLLARHRLFGLAPAAQTPRAAASAGDRCFAPAPSSSSSTSSCATGTARSCAA